MLVTERPAQWLGAPIWRHLLLDIDVEFDPVRKRQLSYTVTNIATVLSGVAPPLPFRSDVLLTSMDVMAGYLMFDALILHRDRHARNWAVLQPRTGGQGALCSLYDNASSLGLSMSDDRVGRICGSKGVGAYVKKAAMARAFAQREGRDNSLFDIAVEAFVQCSAVGRTYWLERLQSLSEPDVASVVAQVPDLSEPLRTFVPLLVANTRWSLLDAA